MSGVCICVLVCVRIPVTLAYVSGVCIVCVFVYWCVCVLSYLCIGVCVRIVRICARKRV